MKGFLERETDARQALKNSSASRRKEREGLQPLDPQGFTLLNTGGRALGSQVSETSRLTAPKRWLLSVPVSSFFACYVHLVGEGTGCLHGVGRESKPRSFGFKKRLGGSAQPDGPSRAGSLGPKDRGASWVASANSRSSGERGKPEGEGDSEVWAPETGLLPPWRSGGAAGGQEAWSPARPRSPGPHLPRLRGSQTSQTCQSWVG